MKKHKKALAVLLAVTAAALSAVVGGRSFAPHLAVIPDMVKVGLDYIDLDVYAGAPDAEAVLAALESTEEQHPFVLAGQEAFDTVRAEYAAGTADGYTAALTRYALDNAQALLDESVYPPLPYELDEEDSILPISRETISRMVILGFAWQVTGEERYAARAWRELENVCAYPDWRPSHFLAAAEMALAVSVGADWLHDYLTDEQRQLLADTALRYAVTPALSKNVLKNWFAWSKNNWNSICYSGVGIACMTFWESFPEQAAEFLAKAFHNMPIAFANFTPDGVYAEGPGYCESGMNSIVYFIATAREKLGTDYGMSDIPGFRELGLFPVVISGSTGEFNFGDNKDRKFFSPALYWYASAYDIPLLAAYQRADEPGTFQPGAPDATESSGNGRENALSALWYDARFNDDADFSDQPLSVYLRSDAGQELVLLRSAYLDENAAFAGFKAGYNFINHGDLDIGDFVYDALGERWAEELGPGPYDAPGYFFNPPAGGRWRNYCKRAEGQNTLVISPHRTPDDQYALARCVFSDVVLEENGGGSGAIDMTDAYRMNGATSVRRAFSLDTDTGALTVSDAVRCLFKSNIYWFMHTKAEINVAPDGKSAILTQNGKQVKATLSGDGAFSVTPAVTLKPGYVYGETHEAINRLTVSVEDAKTAAIAVTLTPLTAAEGETP